MSIEEIKMRLDRQISDEERLKYANFYYSSEDDWDLNRIKI